MCQAWQLKWFLPFEKLTKFCCILLWYFCLNLTINLNVGAVLSLKRPLCSFAASSKALHILFELKQLAECSSSAADKLVVLAERKPKPADKLEEFAERKPRPAGKLMVLAERKPRPAGKLMVLAEHKPRPAGKGSLLCASQGLLAVKSLLCTSQGLLAKESLLCKSHEHQGLLANFIGNCWLQQLAALLKIPALIFYCGIAHKFEYLLNQYSCLEALHPALAHCTLPEFSVVKRCLEALHPNPFV
jgi:hypothetical protein